MIFKASSTAENVQIDYIKTVKTRFSPLSMELLDFMNGVLITGASDNNDTIPIDLYILNKDNSDLEVSSQEELLTVLSSTLPKGN